MSMENVNPKQEVKNVVPENVMNNNILQNNSVDVAVENEMREEENESTQQDRKNAKPGWLKSMLSNTKKWFEEDDVSDFK